jgi:hypothetical protein
MLAAGHSLARRVLQTPSNVKSGAEEKADASRPDAI